MDIMNLAAKISLDSSGFESGLKGNESALKGFGDKISAWTIAKGKLIADFAEKAASAVGGFIKDSVQEGMEFDTAMSQVAATMGMSVEELADPTSKAAKDFHALEDFARQMGATTKFTATEAAGALNYMALAGYKTEESIAMLPNVMNLASAGAMDLKKASDMLTDSQTAFGISFDRTTQLVDEMAKAASTGNTSVEQLGEAYLVVGALAQNLSGGMTQLADGTLVPTDNIQEMTTALVAMANAGIKGGEAGTHLRNMINKLSDTSEEGAKKLEEMGVHIFDEGGNMKSLSTIFKDLGESFKTMTNEQKMDVIGELFNVRDMASAQSIINAITGEYVKFGDEIYSVEEAYEKFGEDIYDSSKGFEYVRTSWDQIAAAILDSEGAAEKMSLMQLANLEGDTKMWNSALSEVRLSIAKKLTPTLRKFIQTGTEGLVEIGEAMRKDGFAGGLKVLGKFLGEKFPAMFKELGPKIKNGFKSLWSGVKTGLASMLGVDSGDDATWGEIAAQAFSKLWGKLKSAAATTKVNLANWLGLTDASGNPVDSADDTTWGNIIEAAHKKLVAKIQDAGNWGKVKLANWLGLTDEKGGIIDSADDTTWANIAEAAYKKLTGKLTNFADYSKVKLANWLGLTDEAGNPVDEADDTSWSKILSSAYQKLTGKLTEFEGYAKVNLANWLGLTDENGNPIDDSSDTSWADIAKKAYENVKNKLTKFEGYARVSLAEWLGLVDENGQVSEDVSWGTIAETAYESIKEKLSEAAGGAKASLAKLLGLVDDNGNVVEDASWKDIGRSILEKITGAVGKGGSFLQQLILGDDYVEGSEDNWKKVGNKIVGGLRDAFSEGGIADTFFKNIGNATADIITFAGTFAKGFFNKVSELFTADGGSKASGIIEAVITSLINATGKIVKALVGVITDPQFNQAIAQMMKNIWQSIFGTPEDRLNENLFGGFSEETASKGAQAIQDYIDAYNSYNRESAKLEEQFLNGEITWDQYEELSASLSVAHDKMLELYDAMMKVTDENGKNLFSSYMTWINDQGYKAGEDLPDFPVELMPNDEKIKATTDAGYSAIVHLIPDSSAMPDAPNYVKGSFAKGEWNVPYDNFLANLHRGETVLSASQARDYREGNSGNFDLGALKSEIVSSIREGLQGATVRSYLNGRDITQEINRNNMQSVKARRFAT